MSTRTVRGALGLGDADPASVPATRPAPAARAHHRASPSGPTSEQARDADGRPLSAVRGTSQQPGVDRRLTARLDLVRAGTRA
jgi:hypothetical protein